MRKFTLFLWSIGLGFTLVAFLPITSTYAESEGNDHNKLFEVQTDSIIMRVSPGEEADIVGELKLGDRLRTFEEVDGWVKTFYKGQPVWIFAESLLLIEENKPADEVEDVVEDEQINGDKSDTDRIVDHSDENTFSYPHEDFFFEKFKPEHASDEMVEIPMGFYKPKQVLISEDTIVVMKNALHGFKILIDAGHGGRDSGAINDGVLEKDLTLNTAKKVSDFLEKEGAIVDFTREDDRFISLENRVQQSNQSDTDAFISLHYDYFNDEDAQGITSFYYDEETSRELAASIHAELMNNLDVRDRNVRKEAYYVLRNNKNPAVLLELGFMTNEEDLDKIQSEEYQDAVAKAITDGLSEYFNENNDE